MGQHFSLLCIVALASLGYEKTCVLFNTAALASQIAAEQNLDNDEGLKAAARYYQVSILHATEMRVPPVTKDQEPVSPVFNIEVRIYNMRLFPLVGNHVSLKHNKPVPQAFVCDF